MFEPAHSKGQVQNASALPFPWFRLVLLITCIAVGVLVGVVGQAIAGNSSWFLAIPTLVLVAWFFVGNPSACLPPDRTNAGDPPPT